MPKPSIHSMKTITYKEIIRDTGSAILVTVLEKGTAWMPKKVIAIHPISKEIILPYWLFYKIKWK